MSVIQLDISDVVNLKNRILQIANEIDECYKEVTQTANSIDMKVSKRKDIDMDLQHIKTDLKKQKDFLQQCANLINESINEFVNAEKIDRLPNLNISGAFGNTANLGEHGKINNRVDINDVIIGAGLIGLGETSNLFSKIKGGLKPLSALDNPQLSQYVDSLWSDSKTLKKGASFTKDTFEIIENYGGEIPEQLKNIVGSDAFKVIGYLSDAEKLVKVITERDAESYTDLLGKYGIEEPIKALVKLGGESSAGASLVADFAVQTIKSTAEITSDRVAEIYGVLANPESDWKDYVKCVESLCTMQNDITLDTAWNVVGDKAQTMTEILDFTGLTDLGEHFEEITGKEDATIIDFYETAASEIGALCKNKGLGRTLEYFAEAVSEVVSEQMTDLSDMFADWIDRSPVV